MAVDFKKIISEVEFSAIRSRGPGGQNVNKVSSAAVLKWDYRISQALTVEQKEGLGKKLSRWLNKEGLVTLRSDEFRDLPRNKSRCLEKLEKILKVALTVPKTRKRTKPTQASKIRRKEKKQRRSKIKKLRQKVY